MAIALRAFGIQVPQVSLDKAVPRLPECKTLNPSALNRAWNAERLQRLALNSPKGSIWVVVKIVVPLGGH